MPWTTKQPVNVHLLTEPCDHLKIKSRDKAWHVTSCARRKQAYEPIMKTLSEEQKLQELMLIFRVLVLTDARKYNPI
jgi:hypothetical protein